MSTEARLDDPAKRMTLRRHAKHRAVSGLPTAEYVVMSGDTGVAVSVRELDPYGIPHPGVVLAMSVRAARALARRLTEEADKAEALGAYSG